MFKKLTLVQFIEKARLIHGDRFDYSRAVYINNSTKILIICPVHGEFWQKPANHLQGKGCSKCNYEKKSHLQMFTLNKFIQKAIIKHNYFYDYSKSIYDGIFNKLTIICPIHGEFQQTPHNHLNGQGCRKCFKEQFTLKHPTKLTIEEFIKRAIALHGNKYDYNKAVYINAKTKLIILCPVHGEFEQTPSDHLQGKGCPICKASKGEVVIKSILVKYKIKCQQEYIIPEVVSQRKYDFYLPEYRLLIEFHGIQHYEYIPFLHKYDEDNFLSQKDRDNIKKDNANQFKYHLLEFNYKQFEKLSQAEFEQMVIDNINKYKKIIIS